MSAQATTQQTCGRHPLKVGNTWRNTCSKHPEHWWQEIK